MKERHTEKDKARNREATRNRRSTAHHGWHEYGVGAPMQTLEPYGVIHKSDACNVHEKNDV